MKIKKQYAITGIRQADKLLIKRICQTVGITQREWVRRHLEADHTILKEKEGLSGMDNQEEFQGEYIDVFKEDMELFETQSLRQWSIFPDSPHYVLDVIYKVVEKIADVLNTEVERDTITPSTRLICLVEIYNKAEKIERKIKGDN